MKNYKDKIDKLILNNHFELALIEAMDAYKISELNTHKKYFLWEVYQISKRINDKSQIIDKKVSNNLMIECDFCDYVGEVGFTFGHSGVICNSCIKILNSSSKQDRLG